MIKFFEVRPNAELKPQQTDRYIELKTATLGYFEAQIFRHRDDGTHYDAADLFAVADAAEADMLLAALQQELPDVDFTIAERVSESGTRFNPQMI
jgi:hypothetical protein